MGPVMSVCSTVSGTMYNMFNMFCSKGLDAGLTDWSVFSRNWRRPFCPGIRGVVGREPRGEEVEGGVSLVAANDATATSRTQDSWRVVFEARQGKGGIVWIDNPRSSRMGPSYERPGRLGPARMSSIRA